MSIYTVHEPPDAGGATTDPHRFVFVRDGFAWPAFVLAPVWMIWHSLWLVLVGYLVLLGVVLSLSTGLGLSDGASTAVTLLVSLLVGFEAATLRRWTLTRRGWSMVGTVTAEDADVAEQRFFDAWVRKRGATKPPQSPPTTMPATSGVTSGSAAPPGVVGLFPEPDMRQ